MPSERTGQVAGILLAAGMSTRMGRNKLLLELDGEPLLRHVALRALAAKLDPVIAVLGFEAGRLQDELAGLGCRIVVNPDFASGIHTSLRLGVLHVPPDAIAAAVLLADMPFVSAAMLRELIARYRRSDAPLVLSRYGDTTAPPTVFDRELFAELDDGDPASGGRAVVARHRERAAVVQWSAAALIDLDVPEDYERVKTRLMVGS